MVNTVMMMYQPGPISGLKFTATYGRWMTGVVGYHFMQQRQMLVCEEFGTELAAASMATHLHTQHSQSGQDITLPSSFNPPNQK